MFAFNDTIAQPHNQEALSTPERGQKRPRQRDINRERSIWADKKNKSASMAARLSSVGKVNRYYRMRDCANTIVSDVCCKCETRYVVQTSFCRDRLCPVCTWRRSKRLNQRLGEIITMCEAEHRSRYIFLTLTVRNVPWNELGAEIKAIQKSWDRMNKRIRRAASVTGWVKTFEVTRSKTYGDAHPHLHVLMQVPPSYFDKESGLAYHRQDELVKQWQQCLKAEYSPLVSINAVKDTNYHMGAAIAETTKYIAKSSDVAGLCDGDFSSYVNAISGVRSWSTGGRMKISDEEVEAFLHDKEMTHEQCQCGNCGGGLSEMREVWDADARAYRVVVDVNRSGIEILHGTQGQSNQKIIILNNGGVVNVGGVDSGTERTRACVVGGAF